MNGPLGDLFLNIFEDEIEILKNWKLKEFYSKLRDQTSILWTFSAVKTFSSNVADEFQVTR